MTEHSTRATMIALLAKHEDDGLEDQRRHTYIWDRSDGREKLKKRTLIDLFRPKRRTA